MCGGGEYSERSLQWLKGHCNGSKVAIMVDRSLTQLILEFVVATLLVGFLLSFFVRL